MPGSGTDASDDDAPGLSVWQRFLLALPRVNRDGEKRPLGTRVSEAMLKPPQEGTGKGSRSGEEDLSSAEELEAAVRWADDNERLIGLVLAPLAAAIGFVITSAQISRDKTGQTAGAVHHVNALYLELGATLMLLALVTLVAAWLRKRFFMGAALALYGLAVFNLHYWEFGVPFLLAGSWYLVRVYRLQAKLKLALAEEGGGSRPGTGPTPKPNKRYTPPSGQSKRKPPAKPQDDQPGG